MYGVESLNPGLPEDKTRCVKEVQVYSGNWPSYHQCHFKRGHGKDGLYCKKHDPEAVKKRKQARSDKWEKNHAAKRREWQCVAALEGIRNPAAVKRVIRVAKNVRYEKATWDSSQDVVVGLGTLQNALAALDQEPDDD